ncbi:MAG: hypothetical protein GY941_17020 [Planctomycetes bacterium]|nr:hypothetical protein [Planctomycetota bacterium]
MSDSQLKNAAQNWRPSEYLCLIVHNTQQYRNVMQSLQHGPTAMEISRFNNIVEDVRAHRQNLDDHAKFMVLSDTPHQNLNIVPDLARLCHCLVCLGKMKNQRQIIAPDEGTFWYCVACHPAEENAKDVNQTLIWMISAQCSFDGPTGSQLLENIWRQPWGRTFLENMNYTCHIGHKD